MAEQGLEESDLALTQDLDQEVGRDLPLFDQAAGQNAGGLRLVRFRPVLFRVARDGLGDVFELVVEPAGLDVEVFENMGAKRGGDPKVHALRQFPLQVAAFEQRLLIGVDAARFLGQIHHGRFGNLRVRIFEQGLDHVLVAGLHERVGNVLAERAAHGDHQLVLLRSMADHPNQFGIAQHLASHENRLGDLDIVVREGHDQVVRRIGGFGQALAQVAPDRHLAVVDQFAQDVGHERAFTLGQDLILLGEEIADRGGQHPAALERFVERQVEQKS